jgi:alpha-maltose-1-phosphate synthase
MNICMVMSTPFPPQEGIGSYVNGLSSTLQESGHKVTIITRGSLRKTSWELVNDMQVIKPPYIPVYPFYIHLHGLFVNKIVKSIEKEIDIIHIHSPLCPKINTSLPILATIHTPMLTDTQTRVDETTDFHARIEHFMGKYVSYPIEMNLIKRAEKITTVANSVADELQVYGLQKKDIEVIGNGVDESLFHPLQTSIDERFILFTGRLDYRKGLFDLIESSKYILREHPNISFLITGKGILIEKLKKRVHDLGFSKNFSFLGFVPKEKLIQLYQQATIYALPSHYEGLPTVLLEAMACGCPVVATAVSGNLDVITHGIDGLLVPPKEPEKIAESIMHLLYDEEKRKKMGNNARKTIEKRFTWKKITNSYIEKYESLLR